MSDEALRMAERAAGAWSDAYPSTIDRLEAIGKRVGVRHPIVEAARSALYMRLRDALANHANRIASERGQFIVRVFPDPDVRNLGRQYPRPVMERALERARLRMRERRFVGTIIPPDMAGDYSTGLIDGGRDARIDQVSHLVLDAMIGPDGRLRALCEPLDTTHGRILSLWCGHGTFTLAGYLAGLGSCVRAPGADVAVVQHDYELRSIDIAPAPVDDHAPGRCACINGDVGGAWPESCDCACHGPPTP